MSKQAKIATLPCFILIAWKWFWTAEVKLGAISSSTITWICKRYTCCSGLGWMKVHLCLCQAVISILPLAKISFGHQLVTVLHVQVFVSNLHIKWYHWYYQVLYDSLALASLIYTKFQGSELTLTNSGSTLEPGGFLGSKANVIPLTWGDNSINTLFSISKYIC